MLYAEEAKQEVLALYVDNKYSINQVVAETGVPFVTVQRWIKGANCMRSAQEARKIAVASGRIPLHKGHLLPDVKKLYLEERLSCEKIGSRLNLHRDTVARWLRRENCMRTAGETRFRGRKETPSGYIKIYHPHHHRANKDGYVLEHILIWEQTHNRPLPKGWLVHHLNGIKNDNRPENLVGLPRKRHGQVTQLEPYKRHIRELEAKVKLLERALDNQQMIWWSEN